MPDAAAALAGAGHILAERLSEDADARAAVRRLTWEQGLFSSRVGSRTRKGRSASSRCTTTIASRCARFPPTACSPCAAGEKEEVLRLAVEAPEEEILLRLKGRLIRGESIFPPLAGGVAEDAYRRLIAPSIEVGAAPGGQEAGRRGGDRGLRRATCGTCCWRRRRGASRVLGIDPGLRTGSKLAAVDGTGRFLEHATIYPHTGAARVAPAQKELLRLVGGQRIEMIAIGNGTAGREMEQFVRETLRGAGRQLPVVMVNEAGASVYSASEIAREEFPELDLTVRGAISIARRLQDPLAELVKIDPKSIGVGQYQHDVNQSALKKALDAVVESCVNFVGVDLNTASWALLSYVSGIGESLARGIVRASGRKRPLRHPPGAAQGAPLRRQGLRAGGGLSAHPRRREPPRQHRRPSGALPAGGDDGRRPRGAPVPS